MEEIEISPKEVRQKLDTKEKVLIIDVREPWERDLAKIEEARLIPLNTLPSAMKGIPKDVTIITQCHHGIRSLAAARFLRAHGFPHAYSMAGGIEEWSLTVDKKVPRY